jgi:hypothetical protein
MNSLKRLYNTASQQILPWPRLDEEPIVGLDPNLLEMAVIEGEIPGYNPETQILTKSDVVNVEARTITRTWALSNLTYTAEDHIEREGFPAMRLVALMDLEGKLATAGKTSAKLVAVRSWLDLILGAFAFDPEPRNDWPTAPFGFEETVQDAAISLNN